MYFKVSVPNFFPAPNFFSACKFYAEISSKFSKNGKIVYNAFFELLPLKLEAQGNHFDWKYVAFGVRFISIPL